VFHAEREAARAAGASIPEMPTTEPHHLADVLRTMHTKSRREATYPAGHLNDEQSHERDRRRLRQARPLGTTGGIVPEPVSGCLSYPILLSQIRILKGDERFLRVRPGERRSGLAREYPMGVRLGFWLRSEDALFDSSMDEVRVFSELACRMRSPSLWANPANQQIANDDRSIPYAH
jgi:hypothetical protein